MDTCPWPIQLWPIALERVFMPKQSVYCRNQSLAKWCQSLTRRCQSLQQDAKASSFVSSAVDRASPFVCNCSSKCQCAQPSSATIIMAPSSFSRASTLLEASLQESSFQEGILQEGTLQEGTLQDHFGTNQSTTRLVVRPGTCASSAAPGATRHGVLGTQASTAPSSPSSLPLASPFCSLSVRLPPLCTCLICSSSLPPPPLLHALSHLRISSSAACSSSPLSCNHKNMFLI